MNSKKAFTLAETLITLAIIGVVMALMLRAINRVNPDKEKILFLKAYHGVEAVIAEAINDPTYYDQSYYTDQQRADYINDGGTLHMDFRDDPFANASVVVAGAETTGLTKSNAICYFLATGMNTIGDVNCTDTTKDNFRTTNGVCFSGWIGALDNDKYKDGTIKPTCDSGRTITVRVFRDGKITVPSAGGTLQSSAIEWLKNQTDLN